MDARNVDTSDAKSNISDSYSTMSEACSNSLHASTTASDTPLLPIEGIIPVQDHSLLDHGSNIKLYAKLLQETQEGKKVPNSQRLLCLQALCYDLSISVNSKDTKSNLLRQLNSWVRPSDMFYNHSMDH